MVKETVLVDAIDREKYPLTEGVFLSELNIRLRSLILKDFPQLIETDFISNKNIAKYRLIFLEIIEAANKKNDHVRETVYDVTKNQHYTTLDVQQQWDKRLPLVKRLLTRWQDLEVLGFSFLALLP